MTSSETTSREMTSYQPANQAFVWVWLPEATEPVVCGRLDNDNGELLFTYGRSYLERGNAMALHPALANDIGLALSDQTQRPPPGLDAHGSIRDAAPDAWGMRVNARRLAGIGADTNALPLLSHLLAAGSNRIGALHVQSSPTEFTPLQTSGTLEELAEASERIAANEPLTPELDAALNHASSVGGARPKATMTDAATGVQHIVKFSVSNDVFPWIEAEAVGMEIARRCGVETARSTLSHAAGRAALIVDRFDRPPGGTRRHTLSALTLVGLNELVAHRSSYLDLVTLIRQQFTDPDQTLEELFTRIAVNIVVGNTDDHLRNHAAFWDGHRLSLTPAYDVCPQPRDHGEASQALPYGPNGLAAARLGSLHTAAHHYRLSPTAASAIIERCSAVAGEQLHDICAAIGVSERTHETLAGRSVNNRSIHYPHEQ